MRRRINDLSGMQWGRVSVATQSTIAAEVMPSVIAAFRANHGRCTVDVHMVENVLAHVQVDEVDIGIGFNLPIPAGVELVFECPVSPGVVVPPGHPLADRASLTLAACAGYPLILPSPAMSMRPALDMAFDAFADMVQFTVESNSVELMKSAAQMGQGIAVLTALNVAAERKRGQLVCVPLREASMKPLQLRGTWKKRRQPGALALPFVRQCELTVSSLLASVGDEDQG
jgi:DNA-binding transcriptional LysR family regulator